MSEEEFIIKFYSCDNEEQFLKDIYHNLNCLQQENEKLKSQLNGTTHCYDEVVGLDIKIDKIIEDINFCLHSIKQEMKISKDERTRSEMTDCYKILSVYEKVEKVGVSDVED